MRLHESSARRASISGIRHIGPCRACKKRGEEISPRSAGCSRRYSAPASRAARRSEAQRRTSRLVCSSSRAC
eukprot:5882155-Pleurochrysis_carterae.AAC.2